MRKPQSRAPSRRARRLLVWAVAVVALGALALEEIPDRIAQRLLAAELEQLELSMEGLATLDVEVLGGEISIGPVRVRHAGGSPAALELADLDVSLGALFADRVVLEDVALSGLDVHVTVGESGLVLINGLPVDLEADEASPREFVRALLGGRDLGVERLEIGDSRMLLEGAAGGQVTVEVERLSLADLRGWEPEHAARIELVGSANEVSVTLDGELGPFADEPSIALDTTIEGIGLERIERALGPMRASRRAGVARFEGRHESRILPSGALTGRTRGTLAVDGLDLAGENGLRAATERAELALDVAHEGRGADDWRVSGQVELRARAAALEHSEEARLAFGSLRIVLEEAEASMAAGALGLRWTTALTAEAGHFDGRIRISTELLILAVQVLQDLAASGDAGQKTGLEVWAGREVATPRSEVEVSRLALRDRFTYEGGRGSFTLGLDSQANAADVQVVSQRQRTDLGALELELETLRLASGDGAVTLAGDLSLEATEATGTRERGRATVDTVTARLERASLRSEAGMLEASAGGTARLSGMRGTVSERDEAPPATFGVSEARVVVDAADVSATAESGRWTLRGQANAGSAALDVGLGLKATAKISGAELRDVTLDESLRISVGSATLTGAELAATRSYLGALVADGPDGTDGSGAEPEAPVREPEGKLAGMALVERTQRALAALGDDPGPIDGITGPKTVAAIERFQEAAALPVDGEVSAELLAAVEAAASTGPRRRALRRRPTVAIAKLVARDGARVHFSDDTVTPDVDSHVELETLSVAGLDTGDPARAAEIRAVASINEFSRLEIEGQVTPFKQPPDVDLRLQLSGLQLTPYSPYVSELSGIAVEEGVLSSEATARIVSGSVDARVTVDLQRLEVEALSEEDAERVAEALGVRADTAVRLLKDAEGRIELTIPVSGTIDEPEVDLGEAINRAVTGVLAALFPPNVIAAMLEGGDGDVEFKPVIFEPGSTDLAARAREYLDDLAALMAEHPQVVITLCGRAVASDAGAIAAMFTERLAKTVDVTDVRVASHAGALAVDRTRAARRHLTTHGGVDPAMITECRASFDADDGGEPRVEIAL